MTDPYNLLGVSQKATQQEIKSAYRKLARKLHPDLNPNDKAAEERFKKVTSAYDLLSDDTKRARYDRGEIDGEGNERPTYSQGFRQSAHPGAGAGGFNFNFDGGTDDILSQFFRQQGNRPEQGTDLHYKLTVSFLEAALGAEKTVTLSHGKTLNVKIPPGSLEGATLRLKNQGNPGRAGGPAGNALIEIHIAAHPYFSRHGNDIHMELPISLQEAILGAKITVPTIHGAVNASIPAESNTGSILRLRGRGIPYGGDKRGDQLVTLKVMLPETIDAELKDFIQSWEGKNDYNPRKKAGLE